MTPEEYRMVRAERIKKVMDSLKERPTSLEEFISQAKTRRKMSETMKESINDGKSEKKDKGNDFETFSLLMRIKKCEELGISYESVLKTQKETLAELIETAAKELTTESLNEVKYKREFISELEFAYKEYKDFKEGIHHGHRFVDLGLPSGTLWADCNVGAEKPEDFGDYFAWGETTPKKEYTYLNYKWSILNNNQYDGHVKKYCSNIDYGCIDNKTLLDLKDDAANANWGGDWRMPTVFEQEELLAYCTYTFMTLNGVKVFKLTSKGNGKCIFLPAAGYHMNELKDVDARGYYWSRSLSEEEFFLGYLEDKAPNCIMFDSDSIDIHDRFRCEGCSIRPVLNII